MPLILPTSRHFGKYAEKLTGKQTVFRGRTIPKTWERRFFRQIVQLFEPLSQDLAERLPWLVRDAGAAEAARVMMEFQDRWRRTSYNVVRPVVQEWQQTIDDRDKERLEKELAKKFGVDTAYVLDQQGVGPRIEALTEQAVNTIQSIPEEYLDGVKTAILNQYANIPMPEGRTLAQQIAHLGGVTESRAQFIARDQTAKMTSSVQQARQTELGIQSYIWRNSQDRRVVGNPAGLYPVGTPKHGNHWNREGKEFRWDEPPSDGHPGWPILCRCYAEPVVVPSELNLA